MSSEPTHDGQTVQVVYAHEEPAKPSFAKEWVPLIVTVITVIFAGGGAYTGITTQMTQFRDDLGKVSIKVDGLVKDVARLQGREETGKFSSDTRR